MIRNKIWFGDSRLQEVYFVCDWCCDGIHTVWPNSWLMEKMMGEELNYEKEDNICGECFPAEIINVDVHFDVGLEAQNDE